MFAIYMRYHKEVSRQLKKPRTWFARAPVDHRLEFLKARSVEEAREEVVYRFKGITGPWFRIRKLLLISVVESLPMNLLDGDEE